MLSENEILSMDFGRSVCGGYRRRAVDRFLVEVATTYAHLRRECEELRRHAESTDRLMRERQEKDQLVRDALATAEQFARDLRRRAEDEATAVVQEAERRAATLVEDAERERDKLEEEIAHLVVVTEQAREECRHRLETALDELDLEVKLQGVARLAPPSLDDSVPSAADGRG